MRSGSEVWCNGTRIEKLSVQKRKRGMGLAQLFATWPTLIYIAIFSFFLVSPTSAQGTVSTSPPISGSLTPSTTSAVLIASTMSDTTEINIPSLPYSATLPPLNASNPALTLNLPSSSSFYVTINICTLGQNASLIPQIIFSTSTPPDWAIGRSNSAPEYGGAPNPNLIDKNGDPISLTLNGGFANISWEGDGTAISPSLLFAVGLTDDGDIDADLIPVDNGNIVFSIEVSEDGPQTYVSPAWLRLGDTTQNSVLLFSPLLQASPQIQPSYPNYTLPGATLTPPSYSSDQTNLTTLGSDLSLIIVPTSSIPADLNLECSLCAVNAASASSGSLGDTSNMIMNATTRWTAMDDVEGYRTMWVVGGLSAQTNYTAWMVDGQGGISQPIWFSTKEDTFPCQLALPNDMCPGIGYAAPLSANESSITISDRSIPYPLETLPAEIASLITSSLNAFSTSLLSTACGRDLFSHVSSCLDCYSAYRDWLCRITVPQCASGVENPLAPISPQTIDRPTNNPRVESLQYPYDYSELLPCISTCTIADRRCPVFLLFRCPRRRTSTSNQSYAFLGEDRDSADGTELTGPPALDQWGNRWCNG